MTQQVPAYFVDYFQKLNAKRRGELVDLFVLEQFVVDIVLAHDRNDSSTLPLQAVILYATFKNITFNLQLNILSQITNISNQIVGFQALASVADTRPPVRPMPRREMDAFINKHGLAAPQTAIIRALNKEIVRELFAIPVWQDIFIKYKMLASVDVRRRICFKYKLGSLIYQLVTGKSKAEVQAQYDTFLLSEKKYNEELEEMDRLKKAVELNTFGLSGDMQNETMRSKVNRQFQKISKATYKFHVHLRLHSSLCVNLLNPQLKKDFSVVINGLDINLVKPKGRFHANFGLMLKNFLVMFNLEKMQKNFQRSIFDGPLRSGRTGGNDRDSIRHSTTPVNQGE